MPLHWTLQSKLRLVTVLAEGDVVRGEIEAYLDMVRAAKVSEWRKLIDSRTARFVLDPQTVGELGVRLRSADLAREMGPLAFVVPEFETPELIRLLGFLAAARRPMRVFDRLEPAQKWILKVGSFAKVS